MTGAWDFPLCQPATNVLTALNALNTAQMYADCLENPGGYFPGDYPTRYPNAFEPD